MTGDSVNCDGGVSAAEIAEAARMLRELLAACQPHERSGVATGHRVEGALVALTALTRVSENDRLRVDRGWWLTCRPGVSHIPCT